VGCDLHRTSIFRAHILLTGCVDGFRIIARTQRLFILNSIDLLVFVIETHCDLCEVITEVLHVN
jgi:hypothetical protein